MLLRAWCVLLALDLGQVAVLAPGSLALRAVVWLAGLWLVTVAAAFAVIRGLLRRSAATTLVVVLGPGLAIAAAELALGAVPAGSTWRPGAVATALGLGFALAALVARVPRGRWWPGLVGALALGIAGAGALGGMSPAVAPPPSAPVVSGRSGPGPNVLLIVVDTLRADHLGCYGYGRPTSPTLDRLAGEGVRFEHAVAMSSWTKPSTASLLTGRPPTSHQTLSEQAKLPEAEITLAERLHALGLRTALLSANPWVTPEYGFDQGMDDVFTVYDERFVRVTLFMQLVKRISLVADPRMRLYNRIKYLVLGELSTTARDTMLVDEALRWLAAHGREPFFLYLHMMSPHHPYDPPPPFDRFVPSRAHAPVKNYPRKSYRFFEHGDPLAPDALADLTARYDGDVLYADTEIARLLAGLEQAGLATSTAVVVTADHGEEFFDHRNWGHGQSVYDELVHVPLIVRLPDGARAGERVATPVSHADVVPTLLELVGARADESLEGRSLVHAAPVRPVWSEVVYRYGEARAFVDGTRKLVVTREGDRTTTALFDLAADPGERTALPASDPDTGRFADALAARVEAARRARSLAVETTADPEGERRLRALGYVDQ